MDAMATSQNTAPSPSVFNFLKEGILLPSRTRNRGLFAAVCALLVVAKLLHEIIHPNDTKEAARPGAGSVLFDIVVGKACQIVVLFAAVEAYSGEQRTTTTFGALLGKAKARLKGPLLTVAFLIVPEIISLVLVGSMGGLFVVLMAKQYLVAVILTSPLVIAASIGDVYFSFLCSLSVVVAVAEPGCCGAAAFGRAWRLAKGRKRQVMLHSAAAAALGAAVSPVHTLAGTWAGNSAALGVLLLFVHAALVSLVQLFAACALTALYYECRENSDGQPGLTGYARYHQPVAEAENLD